MKNWIIVVCEGKAEVNLVSFVKQSFNKRITIENAAGLESLDILTKKLDKIIKTYDRKKTKEIKKLIFYLVLDNDLVESEKMLSYAKSKNCEVVKLEPNIEGYLLDLVSKKVGFNYKTEWFRKQCKDKFEEYFSKKAHDLKNKDWESIFGDDLENNPDPILQGIISIFKN